MMLDSIYKKTIVTKHISVVAWGQKLGRVLQKDIKKFFEFIVVVILVYIIDKTHQTLHLKWVNFK